MPSQLGMLSSLNTVYGCQLGGASEEEDRFACPLPSELPAHCKGVSGGNVTCYHSPPSTPPPPPSQPPPSLPRPPVHAALVELYEATNGTGWKEADRANWLTGEPCADAWEGVTCESGNVTELSLYGVGMTGTLPPSLSELGSCSCCSCAPPILAAQSASSSRGCRRPLPTAASRP